MTFNISKRPMLQTVTLRKPRDRDRVIPCQSFSVLNEMYRGDPCFVTQVLSPPSSPHCQELQTMSGPLSPPHPAKLLLPPPYCMLTIPCTHTHAAAPHAAPEACCTPDRPLPKAPPRPPHHNPPLVAKAQTKLRADPLHRRCSSCSKLCEYGTSQIRSAGSVGRVRGEACTDAELHGAACCTSEWYCGLCIKVM